MFNIKPISPEAIDEALKKAERYRLLNEPQLAESICEDILDIDPVNTDAIKTKLLAITDQFYKYSSEDVSRARHLLPHLTNDYDRAYYAGIICERQGNAFLHSGRPGDHHSAFHWLTDAMQHFEEAEELRGPGQDDPILRWNTCARQIMNHHLTPRHEHHMEPPLE
jgi:hypothetical protein